MTCLVEQADVLEWASKHQGPKFHAILCDPPYHLGPIMTRARPDLNGYQRQDHGQKLNPYAAIQSRTGFMNQVWDGGDIAFRPETWAALVVD